MDGSDISGMRILLADDNESNRKVTMLMLARLGYKCNAVSNGPEAIQAVKLGRYDIVLMEIVMPGMNGMEATREIRGLSQNGLKIIGLTAYVVPRIKEECLNAGMNDCITRPVRMR